MKRKLKKAHKDIQDTFEQLAQKHLHEIGTSNLIYLMMFECFRCLWCEAPSIKQAKQLMKDAMNESREMAVMDKKAKEIIDSAKSEINKTLH